MGVHLRRYLRGVFQCGLEFLMALPSWRVRRLVFRAVGGTIGPTSWIYHGARVRSPSRIAIGENTSVGDHCTLDGRGGLTVGDHVNISSEAAIWTAQHDYRSPTFVTTLGAVDIDDYAWVSFRATVLPGVRIGAGAVVAANSVVTRDVAPWTVVAGIPARRVGDRPRSDYELQRLPCF